MKEFACDLDASVAGQRNFVSPPKRESIMAPALLLQERLKLEEHL